jgi:hypothetical protein
MPTTCAEPLLGMVLVAYSECLISAVTTMHWDLLITNLDTHCQVQFLAFRIVAAEKVFHEPSRDLINFPVL